MLTSFAPFTDGFHETANQVHDWVMQRSAPFFAADRARRRAVTRQTFESYRDECRQTLLRAIGGLPDERIDLKTVQTGHLQRDGYAIRKLIYQALPGYYVTANLYVPDTLDAPAAGVLMACGHHKDGKASPHYQKVCIDLARAGFVTLIIDSPSQGEMVQCLDPETRQPVVGLNTVEHSHLQLSASIIGQNIARYFIHAAMRGIDLLQALPEVDPDRIAMTGNSGGGHLTQLTMLLDPRIKAAMSCCSQTTRQAYLATGSRVYDGEQNLFGVISGGLDYADVFAAAAPRPLRIGAAEYDFFAVEGVLEAVEEARIVYRAMGAETAIDLCVAADQAHGYTTPLRRGCVEWFTHHLQGRVIAPFEGEPDVEPAETLQCTRTGQVMFEFDDARSMIDLHRHTWQAMRSKARHFSRDALAQRLDHPPLPTLRARRTSRHETDGVVAERLFFFSEPGIIVTAAVYSSTAQPKKTALLLIPDGTEGQPPFADLIRSRVDQGELVMVFDVRGTGAVKMRPRTNGTGLGFRSPEFRVGSDHFLLGTSLASRRAYDVRCAIKYLRERQSNAAVEVIGHGWVAMYGLLAAAMEGNVAATFEGLAGSWSQAFMVQPPPDEQQIAVSLILPELTGIADIADLLSLAGSG